MEDAEKQALVDEIKEVQQLQTTEYDGWLKKNLPLMFEEAEDFCNRTFDVANMPAGLTLYLAQVFQNETRNTGVESKKMGNVSVKYVSVGDLNEQQLKRLRKYRKVRFTS